MAYARTNEVFECEFRCGFRGYYDDVVAHEATCLEAPGRADEVAVANTTTDPRRGVQMDWTARAPIRTRQPSRPHPRPAAQRRSPRIAHQQHYSADGISPAACARATCRSSSCNGPNGSSARVSSVSRRRRPTPPTEPLSQPLARAHRLVAVGP